MPLLTRRRLQAMLDELSGSLDPEKARDLIRRLEDKKRVDQVLPAEMELALLWGLSKLGPIEVEPTWWGDDKRPDAVTCSLIPGRRIAVEVAAPEDNAISGEEVMDGVAQELGRVADATERGVSRYLYFSFGEESGYQGQRYFRRRLAPVDYRASPDTARQVETWLSSGQSRSAALELREAGLQVRVERTSKVQTRYHNVWCSMPAETHSPTDNPLAKLLKRKSRQLRGAPADTLRLIFLADGGSTLLRRIGRVGEQDPTRRAVSGREILQHFLAAAGGRLDGIVVWAPQRAPDGLGRDRLIWSVSVFGGLSGELQPGLEHLAGLMPPPRFEGYQGRSLFRQGAFLLSARGWYLGTEIRSAMDEIKVRLPARALLDLLAGRISLEQFRRFTALGPGQPNLVLRWLESGRTLQDICIEPAGLDEDDDHLVLTFRRDPAAAPLEVPAERSAKLEE